MGMKMRENMKAVTAFFIMAAYSIVSMVYLFTWDRGFYRLNILDCGITMPVPFAYLAIALFFLSAYSLLLKQRIAGIAYPFLAMAVSTQLLYLLADMKIGFCTTDPFSGNRAVYGAYAGCYFIAVFSLAAFIGGTFFRKLFNQEVSLPAVFHFPVLLYMSFIEAILIKNGLAFYALYLFGLFALGLLFGVPKAAVKKAKELFAKYAGREILLVAFIFIAAFLVRYFWGVRLLGLTQGKFLMASDDGLCYDGYAQSLARGALLPREEIYAESGFGYWYFLAAIYRIFGMQNFLAVLTVQSFVSALVPVFAYYIAKRIFGSGPVPIIAGIMASIDMTLVFLSVVIGMEAIYIPLVTAALAGAVYLLTAKGFSIGKSFMTGAVFGLAYLVRPPELLLFPAVLAAIIFIAGKTAGNTGKIKALCALFAGFVLFASTQYLTNYFVYGEKNFKLQSAAVVSFHVGSGPGHATENKQLGDMGFSPFEDPSGAAAVLLRRPAEVTGLIAKGFAKRLAMLLFLPNFGVFDPLYLVNPGSGYFFRFPVYAQFYGFLLTVFGIYAALRRNDRRIGSIMLFAFLAYMSARVAFFFVLNSRYRGVLIPVFIIFFAYGLAVFCKKVKDRYMKGRLNYAK